MCGIAGYIGQGSRQDLARMMAQMQHRGPDASNMWVSPEKSMGFGHVRLSILDKAGGVQPMWTVDRQLMVIFNGEIYNCNELRKDLIKYGSVFQTQNSDTEVLLHAYRVWGRDFVSRLNGMWAFALLDFKNNLFFASRDRFGKKPFYYQFLNNELIFASELASLCAHPAAIKDIDSLAIKKYFAYGYIPSPLTQYTSIFKLPAGTNLYFSLIDRKLKLVKYWQYELEPQTTSVKSDSNNIEQLEYLLEQAVDRRLLSDVPIGAFLSGGVDSSIISAIAIKKIRGNELKTFNIGFSEKTFDESAYAKTVANSIGAQHFSKTLTIKDTLQSLDVIRSKLSEPIADSSIVPTYLLSMFAREQVTVALSGDGADELFAGYAPFKALRWAQAMNLFLPKACITSFEKLAKKMPVQHGYMSLDYKIKRALAGITQHPKYWVAAWMAPANIVEINRVVCDGTNHTVDEIYSEVASAWNECTQADLASKTLQFFTNIYLQDDILPKADRVSMMHGLEVRSPFLDIELANFARTLPLDQKLRMNQTKWIVKQVGKKLLPSAISARPKQGFALPIGQWFRSRELSVNLSKLPNYLDVARVAKLQQSHQQGQVDERLFLWAALMLEA